MAARKNIPDVPVREHFLKFRMEPYFIRKLEELAEEDERKTTDYMRIVVMRTIRGKRLP